MCLQSVGWGVKTGHRFSWVPLKSSWHYPILFIADIRDHLPQRSPNYSSCPLFSYCLQVTNTSYNFKRSKKIKIRIIFCNMWNYMEFKFRYPSKFYWHTATAILLCTVYDHFHFIMAELNSCNRDRLAHKVKIFSLWPSIKCLLCRWALAVIAVGKRSPLDLLAIVQISKSSAHQCISKFCLFYFI